MSKFTPVSYNQFKQDLIKMGYQKEADSLTEDSYTSLIKIPQRATPGSAGYDICTPVSVWIPKHTIMTIPTGLRCEMESDMVCLIFIRSSLGLKRGITLGNNTAVLDSDYFYADNEGHIMLGLQNNLDRQVHVDAGERVAQAVFLPYGITEDDHPLKSERTGGIGSSGRK